MDIRRNAIARKVNGIGDSSRKVSPGRVQPIAEKFRARVDSSGVSALELDSLRQPCPELLLLEAARLGTRRPTSRGGCQRGTGHVHVFGELGECLSASLPKSQGL